MSVRIRVVVTIVAMLAVAAPFADAQWLKQPTRGIPRNKDGKPNLKAPAPRVNGRPDLSGLWTADPEGYGFNVAADLKPGEVQPWADALYRQRVANYGTDHPSLKCLPEIGPFSSYGMFKVIQTQDVTAVLTAGGAFRQIHTDGRMLPTDPQPTWMGYSVGRWQGDTFVVETSGFNDKTWLDFGGHPHSEALRVTERFRRTDFGHLNIEITFDDPNVYTRPWTIRFAANYVPDTELLEYVCNENEKDSHRLVVADEERKFVTLPADVLTGHAGDYEMTTPSGRKQNYSVTVAGDRLVMTPEGAAPYEALPLSETRFFTGGTVLDFVREGSNTVGFVIYTVEGELKGSRRK